MRLCFCRGLFAFRTVSAEEVEAAVGIFQTIGAADFFSIRTKEFTAQVA